MNERSEASRRRGGGIAVTGSGSVLLAPDIARLSVAVRWQALSLDEARTTVAAKSASAREHLLAAGVSSSDLQTSQLSVHTIRHRPDRPNVEFAVATTLNAVFRGDLSDAQVAVDGLFDAVGEGLELHGLSFDREDRSAARIEARRLAFEDARAKADQLAALAGASLGPVRSIREGDTAMGPGRPVGARAMMSAEASIPIEGGTLEETVELQVRWSLDHPEPESA